MSWIDVHTHLNMLEMTPEEALQLAADRKVQNVITIGTCPDDLPVVLALAQKFAPRVACTLGIHPHDAELYTAEIGQWIREHAVEPEVAAIGETGLDYYYNNVPQGSSNSRLSRAIENRPGFESAGGNSHPRRRS